MICCYQLLTAVNNMQEPIGFTFLLGSLEDLASKGRIRAHVIVPSSHRLSSYRKISTALQACQIKTFSVFGMHALEVAHQNTELSAVIFVWSHVIVKTSAYHILVIWLNTIT